MTPQTVEKLKAFMETYEICWPPGSPDKVFYVSDIDNQHELLDLPPLPSNGLHIDEFTGQCLEHAALMSDEHLLTQLLTARMVRPMGVFYWIMRFVYEERGFSLPKGS
jgi:hypothetical protein